jgi:hypothetical protein
MFRTLVSAQRCSVMYIVPIGHSSVPIVLQPCWIARIIIPFIACITHPRTNTTHVVRDYNNQHYNNASTICIGLRLCTYTTYGVCIDRMISR